MVEGFNAIQAAPMVEKKHGEDSGDSAKLQMLNGREGFTKKEHHSFFEIYCSC